MFDLHTWLASLPPYAPVALTPNRPRYCAGLTYSQHFGMGFGHWKRKHWRLAAEHFCHALQLRPMCELSHFYMRTAKRQLAQLTREE